MTRILALDIGGTNFSVAIFQDGSLIHRRTAPTDRKAGPRRMLDTMATMVKGLGDDKIDACGIGFGGPVHYSSQRIIASTQVPGWEDFELVREVEERFSTPTIVDRDTLVGALGEGLHGAGVGVRPIFYITLSTGVGGGFLSTEGLLRGADSYACELGHHTVLPDGPECLCGSFGCMERMCSGLWLERDYAKSARELLQDEAFVARYVGPLAQGIKNTIMFYNPARVVIGGGISRAGDALFVPLRAQLRKIMTAWSKARIDVVPAGLGRDTVLWGAMELARTELLVSNNQ